MKRITGICLTLLCAIPAFSSVEYRIEVTDHEQSPATASEMRFLVLKNMLKLDSSTVDGDFKGEMIFRGDGKTKEMIIVNHEEGSFFVIDEKSMQEIAAKLNQAMAMMEQAMANVPEGQREEFEKMMKGRMPKQPEPREKTELRATGESDTINGYPCVKYDLMKSGEKIRELWVTEWKNIEGGREVADAFHQMSEFFKEMMDNLPQFGSGGQSFADPSFEHLREMKGFPILTREFGPDGSLESEAALRSAADSDLGPEAFEPPKGYVRKDMFRAR